MGESGKHGGLNKPRLPPYVCRMRSLAITLLMLAAVLIGWAPIAESAAGFYDASRHVHAHHHECDHGKAPCENSMQRSHDGGCPACAAIRPAKLESQPPAAPAMVTQVPMRALVSLSLLPPTPPPRA
jgi:hypothetical protein